MATTDLSRSATDYRKHYRGVRAQQGRVFTDDDHNESERLHDEAMRRVDADVIGPAGSPDGGFRITNPRVVGGAVDFDINAGAFYLAGHRLELEQPETFRDQRDWLQLRAALGVTPPAAARRDLVYVEAWTQAVSSTEDRELVEVGLGGVDTGTRVRLMRRVRVAQGLAAGGCTTAMQEVAAAWAAQHLGSLGTGAERVPDTRLRVNFLPGGNPADLCSPSVMGGYVGAENQAIRVQLVDATHFTWGFDNGGPLYRVQVGANGAGQRVVVTLLSAPRDRAHWPRAGQVVELLPWSAVLANGERLAELRGMLAKVAGAYDPDTQQLALDTAVPATFGQGWTGRADAAQLGAEQFFYLRVWDRGGDTASLAALPFALGGAAVPLGQTGLSVSFLGADAAPDDYWIIAARPESPNRVVPWTLEAGRTPHGVRRFYAPLALVEWGAGGANPVVHDCRIVFPPLTLRQTCCTFTVGDGLESVGRFTRIQDAIDALPDEGGEVCVLPGTYRERLVIVGRRQVTVKGCGRRSRLLVEGGGQPAVRIADSFRTVLRGLAIEARRAVGVQIESSDAAERRGEGTRNVHLEELYFTARDVPAVACLGGGEIRVRTNDVHVVQLAEVLTNTSAAGLGPAVFVRAHDVLVERNQIRCDGVRSLVTALGGVQIGGGSARVTLHRNRIEGGNGNGVTLGSVSYRDPQGKDLQLVAWIATIAVIDDAGCVHVEVQPTPPEPPEGQPPLIPVSDGDVDDVRITENDILGMGANGIGSLAFALGERQDVDSKRANVTGLRFAGTPLVRGLDVYRNRIRQCLRLERASRRGAQPFAAGLAGVSLLHCERALLRGNWIEENGRLTGEAVCGVFVAVGAALVIEENEILNNGAGTDGELVAGVRGGIVVLAAGPLRTPDSEDAATRADAGAPAARIHGNVVIAPAGPALHLAGSGAFAVDNNHLVSRGLSPTSRSDAAVSAVERLGGASVRILNLGGLGALGGMLFSQIGRTPAKTVGAPMSALFGRGDVRLDGNEVRLELADAPQTPLLSAVLVLTGGDASVQDNQCEALLGEAAPVAHAYIVGGTVRVEGNVFREAIEARGVSALTIARLMNFTATNEGTRCFTVLGPNNGTVDRPNLSLVEQVNRGACSRLRDVVRQVQKIIKIER